MKERNRIGQWFKDHKKQLLIAAGCAATATMAVVIATGHHEEIKMLLEPLTKLKKTSTEMQYATPHVERITEALNESKAAGDSVCEVVAINPYFVSGHIRNLHEGWHASSEKIAEAQKKGINLNDGQTFVNPYVKGGNII